MCFGLAQEMLATALGSKRMEKSEGGGEAWWREVRKGRGVGGWEGWGKEGGGEASVENARLGVCEFPILHPFQGLSGARRPSVNHYKHHSLSSFLFLLSSLPPSFFSCRKKAASSLPKTPDSSSARDP